VPLILLRHTRPEGAAGICYGRTDLALRATFAAEAARLATDLPPLARLVSSPLGRCRRLADRIAAARALRVEVDARIAEMDFGRWEGRRWSEIARADLDAWAADFEGARPHGGESPAMLAARVGAALHDVGPAPVLWVTHAGVARAACALLGRLDGWHTRLDFGAWIELDMPTGTPHPRR
jgi:alpha-ribazole phosphatase